MEHERMAFTTPIHSNEQSIDRVLHTGLPVMLVFWQKACVPCEQLNPVLDRLASVYAGKVLITKIDAADNPALVRRYNVTHLPSLIVVKDGRVVAQAIGAATEASLRSWLDALLSGAGQPSAPSGASVPLQGAPRPHAGPQPPPSRQQPPTSGLSGPAMLSEATFDQIVGQSKQPVLVDFWAPWCGPCRMIAPTVEQLAREFAGRAVVAKLNIDEYPRIAQRYGIMSIPAVYIFRGGRVVDRLVGAQPAPVLRQALEKQMR
jgi:thioredoxin 1